MVKQLPKGSIGFLVALTIATATGVAYSASQDEPVGEGTVVRASDSQFPDPAIETLEQPLEVEGTSLSLDPPGVGLTVPGVDGIAAVELAEDQFGPSALPDKVTARLARDAKDGRLIWAVSFEGICVLERGPAGKDDAACGGTELIVIVDASTGNVYGMVSFR